MPLPSVQTLRALCACATLCLLAAAPAGASPITGLFNTGVDDQGAVRPTNTGLTDLHYSVSASAYTLKDAFWGSPWLPNTAKAGWLAPFYAHAGWSFDAGHYLISTVFNLAAGEDASTAGFTARVASDNFVTVALNGHSVGNGGGLNAFATVTASQYFVSGANTLTFDLGNAFCGSGCQNPAGLIVEFTESHVSALATPGGNVPEPGSLALVAAALVAGVGSRSRVTARRPG